MDQDTLALFARLTELPGAPGFEQAVRAEMQARLAPLCDEWISDRLGGIYGVRRGAGPRVMVTGHMDEVGLMITSILPNGMLRFHTLGGWNTHVLLGQRIDVIAGERRLTGIIGSTPPHLQDDSQKNKPLDVAQMYIDIGASTEKEAHAFGVRPGQQAVPTCPFTVLPDGNKIMAKAWDNRYGCGLAIQLLQDVLHIKLPNELYCGATVQEEVGLRGARAAATLIQPDIFYGLDCSPANDMMTDRNVFGVLGKGVLLRILDRTMITNPRLVEFIRDTAESERIPYQYFVSPGGTDAGDVHTSGIGVPSAVIGICARYIHTPASIIHREDYAAARQLLAKLVQKTDQTTINTILGM
jgi:putative aminopeptidase FrvX